MAGETLVTLVGNLTAEPELRYTQNGLAVVNFTIASTPKVFDRQANAMKDGEAMFMRCTVWREFAEHVAQSLTKGSRVIAQGRLGQRSYESTSGEKRTTYEVEIDAIGPDLRFATVVVERTSGQAGAAMRNDRNAAAAQPAWAQPQTQQQPITGLGGAPVGGSTYDDETPF